MPQLQLNVLFSNGKAICFFPTTALQTREEFELFLEREYEKFYPTDSVSIKNVQYLHVDKSSHTPIKFELPTNWDDATLKTSVRSNIVEVIFGKNPMIFVELDDQPKQNIPQYEIVSPIPASSRKKQVERASISTVATSLEFSTTNNTMNDDEKVVIFEVDDDSIFDKPIAEKELENKQSSSEGSSQVSPVIEQKQIQTSPVTTVSSTEKTDNELKQNAQPSQDSPEIDFDEEIIFSDNEDQVEKQLFPTNETSSGQKNQDNSDAMVIDELSPIMDDILSQSNEEPVKMTDDLNEVENALCTQAVDTNTREEPSQKEEIPSKKVNQTEQIMSPSKQSSQVLLTPQKLSETKPTTPKSSQEKRIAPIFTPKSSQEKKHEQKVTPKLSQESKPAVTTPKSSQEKSSVVTTPKLSQEKKSSMATTPKSSQEQKLATTPKSSHQEKAITPKISQEKKPASATKPTESSSTKPVKQLTPKTPISILSKVKNFKTPNPSQNPKEPIQEKSKSTTKKRKRDQLSTIIAKKAIDSLSSGKKKK